MLKVKAMLCLELLMFTTSAYCRGISVGGPSNAFGSVLGTVTVTGGYEVMLAIKYPPDAVYPTSPLYREAHQPKDTINNCSTWDAASDGLPHLRFSLRDHPAGKAMLAGIRYSIANNQRLIIWTTSDCTVDKTMEDVSYIIIF